MAELSVEISAKMDGLNKALSDSEKALAKFNVKASSLKSQIDKNLIATSKLESYTEKLNKQYSLGVIDQTKYENLTKRITAQEERLSVQTKSLYTDLGKVNKATKQLSNTGMSPLNKSVVSGSSAMTAFSRTVQDAPFGIMGVSNNITNLTEQFGYLKKNTGSTGGALKAMLKDLKGFGGISLGISVATSLLLVFGDELMNAVNSSNALTEAQKELRKELNNFYGGSASKLYAYVSILEDVNTSEKERLGVIDELIKKVPDLKKEDFNYGNNLDIVRVKIGKYVLAQASRIEADTLVQQNSEKLAQKARIVQIKSIGDQEARIKAFRNFLKKEGQTTTTQQQAEGLSYQMGGRGVDLVSNNIIDVEKGSKEITSQFNDFASKLDSDLKPVEDKIKELYSTTFSGGLTEDSSVVESELEKKIKELEAKIKSLMSGSQKEIQKGIQHTFAQGAGDLGFVAPVVHTEYLDKALGGLQKYMDENSPTIEPKINTKGFDENSLAFKERLLMFSNDVNSIVSNGLENTFNSLGDSLGTALANGGNVIQAVGSTILAGLGGFLSDMGGMLIKYGTLAVLKGKLDLAILTGGPVAIAAGAAAIGVGIALKAAGAALGSYAQGGSDVSSDTSTFSGSSSTSYSGGSSSSGGGTYVFEIQGTKLVGVLQNTLNKNKSLGGTLSLS